jgi:hypothetical protein
MAKKNETVFDGQVPEENKTSTSEQDKKPVDQQSKEAWAELLTQNHLDNTGTTAEDKPDSRKILIVRVEHEDGPATCIPYEDGTGRLQMFHPDPEVKEFEVDALVAFACISSGFFEQHPDSKTKSKARA